MFFVGEEYIIYYAFLAPSNLFIEELKKTTFLLLTYKRNPYIMALIRI